MSWGNPIFVLAIIALVMGGVIISNWFRVRHGYPPTDVWGGEADDLGPERQIELLSNENEGLKGKVSRLEERIAVLERIATDPAERTAREIDSLR